MFDQSFLDTQHSARKPLALASSLVLEAAAVCAGILFSIIYSQTLPGSQLRTLLIAPRPPVASHEKTPDSAKPRLVSSVRRLSWSPAAVRVAQPIRRDVATLAPTVGVDYGSGAPGGSQDLQGVIGSILGDAQPPSIKEQPKPTAQLKRVVVGTGVAEANLIRQVQPVYPRLAIQTRVQGTVEFHAIISKEGTIEDLQLVRGHPLLVKAARDAVMQWRYRPTLLNGRPVEVATDILVNFTLAQ